MTQNELFSTKTIKKFQFYYLQREAQRRAVETTFFTLVGHAAANPPIIIRPTRPARHQASTPQRVPASRQATTSQRGPANRPANRQTRMRSSPLRGNHPTSVLSHGVQSPTQGQNPFSPPCRRRRRRNVIFILIILSVFFQIKLSNKISNNE